MNPERVRRFPRPHLRCPLGGPSTRPWATAPLGTVLALLLAGEKRTGSDDGYHSGYPMPEALFSGVASLRF